MRSFASTLAVMSLLFAACGSESSTDLNNVNVVTPTSPTGYAAGIVRNATDESPLSGVRVVIFGGGISGEATTDSSGQFTFGPIAAGAAFSIRFEASGFAPVTFSGLAIDDAAGNFPTANGSLFIGPISLVPIGGVYAVQVVDDSGAAVQNAEVMFEASPSVVGTNFGGVFAVKVMTDIDGIAKTEALPNIRMLSPRYNARLGISVAPVDRNNDGVIELRGAYLDLNDNELREGGGLPVMVLYSGGDEDLQVIASNLGTLIRGSAAFPVIGTMDSLSVVFNKAIERDSVTIDLRDEAGTTMIAAPHTVSGSETIITIDPAEDLLQSREYNLSISAASVRDGVREVYSAATPFFARVDPAVMIAITGRIRDVNGNSAWGDGGDVLEMTVSSPIGRARRPGGNASLWIALDFNGSGVLGDAQGELPPSGQSFPSPFTISLSEPQPPNGAGESGFTRFFGALPINLPTPIGQASGGAAFEVRIEEPLADISGRAAPSRTTGTALLQ